MIRVDIKLSRSEVKVKGHDRLPHLEQERFAIEASEIIDQ